MQNLVSTEHEPAFVNVQGAQESIPPAYVAWRAGMSNRLVVPARQAGNRFLNSWKGLQIRAQSIFKLINQIIINTEVSIAKKILKLNLCFTCLFRFKHKNWDTLCMSIVHIAGSGKG
jgi:hypothetical protein